MKDASKVKVSITQMQARLMTIVLIVLIVLSGPLVLPRLDHFGMAEEGE